MSKPAGKRKGIFWLIVVFACSSAILLCFALFKPAQDFEKKESAKIDGIEEISIDSTYSDISILPSDSNEVQVIFHGKEKSIPKLKVVTENNILAITLERPLDIAIYTGEMKLDVYIPKVYAETLTAKTPSHNISISGLRLNQLNCEASAGSLDIRSISALTTILKTASGNITLADYQGGIHVLTSGGSVNVQCVALDNDISIETASGLIDIALPQSAAFQLEAKTSSGQITSGFEVGTAGQITKNTLVGTVNDGRLKIALTTASGNINIHPIS